MVWVKVRDGGAVTAEGTVRVSGELDLSKAHLQSVIDQKPSQERGADSQDPLDGLGGLSDANDAGQDPQHARFVSAGDQARGGRQGKKAAIAGPSPLVKYGSLSFELKDASIDQGLGSEITGIIEEIFGGEIIGPIQD